MDKKVMYSILMSLLLHATMLISWQGLSSFEPLVSTSGNGVRVDFEVAEMPEKTIQANRSINQGRGTAREGRHVQAGSDVKSISSTDLGVRVQYPKLSRMLGEEGRVIINIIVKDDASVIEVETSSGYERLDKAALSATEAAFERGHLSAHLVGRTQFHIPYTFKLTVTP